MVGELNEPVIVSFLSTKLGYANNTPREVEPVVIVVDFAAKALFAISALDKLKFAGLGGKKQPNGRYAGFKLPASKSVFISILTNLELFG